jgi:hypothetical protein
MSDSLTRDKLAAIISERMGLKISTVRKFVEKRFINLEEN